MKVLLVASWYYSDQAPIRGGFIREQAHALKNAGVDVSVIVFDRDANNPMLSIKKVNDFGVTEYRISLPAPLHRILGFYFPFVVVPTVQKIISMVKPHIVHAHAVRPAGVLASMSVSDIPLIITEHSSPLTKFWMTLHGKKQIKRAYERADEIYAVGTVLGRDIKKHFNIKDSQIIPNGIELSTFQKSKIQDKKDFLLVVCNLESRKMVDKILISYKNSGLSRDLVILGDGPELGRLKTLTKKLEIEEKVIFKGNVTRDSVSSYMRKAHALIQASSHETFSLVCAEAIASGTYVITSRCGGPEDFVIAPFGEFFDVGNTDQLSKILHEHDSFEYSEGFIEQAHKYIEGNYSIISLSNKLIENYKKVTRS